MKIFEDLVEELKEENLLEETVIETSQQKEREDLENARIAAQETAGFDGVLNDETENNQAETLSDETEMTEDVLPKADVAEIMNAPTPALPTNESEFYSKRATEEVTGLQMVEHVFSGVEREQMKVVPKPYDDLECKKALHAFLQISQSPNSPEHAKSEFHLMQETESWYSALSHRDKNISVTHLRRFCETTKPILSSTAMISLARFYRNSPFSEQVRSKFDLILTRLFTKEVSNDKRESPFTREELIKHLNMLYSQWASIQLYAASEEDSDILIITLKFEDFMAEAESADSFDELVKNDFFNRLRNFKESTNENFFAPLVTATAIECNVRIGNRYVDLIQREKEKVETEILEDKYGFLHDQAISESSSKTLQLVHLLRERIEESESEVEEIEKVEVVKVERTPAVKPKKAEKNELFKVNKWLLAATILIVIVNTGLYFWMNGEELPQNSSQSVQKVNLENSVLKDFVKEGRITNQIFYGLVTPEWSNLDQEKKEDVLKKLYATSAEKGFAKVHLLDKDGKTVGFIDAMGAQSY